MENKLLKAAVWYAEHGFSVIPIGKQKKPVLSKADGGWKPYQTQKASIDQIKEWWVKWPAANIGLVTGEISNLLVIDIDLYKDIGSLEKIESLTPEGLLMPIATTPRGGQHRYFKNYKEAGNWAEVLPNVDIRAQGGFIIAPPSKNNSGDYRWIDGCKINEIEIPEIPESYKKLLKSFKGFSFKDLNTKYINNKYCNNHADSENPLSTNCPQKSAGVLNFRQGTRDQDLFHVANCLVKGKMLIHNIQKVLQLLAAGCEPPFSKKEADEKIISALERAEKKDKNLADEVREFVLSTSGHFLSTEVYSCLQLSTRQDKKNISTILSRIKEEGIIEKYGSKNGHWRKIENECQEINWLNTEITELDLKYPLGIHNYFCTMPKNIICIAGSPDSGKTAFLLNFIKLNMYQHEIHYFSSEMGDIELKSRLSNFDIPLTDWMFNPKERAENFADVIHPDAINIIDFLEITKDFYEVGDKIRQIFNRLNNGIAIIALQKNKEAELGRGGGLGLEKPRLYLTLDSEYPGTKAKIIKCKNWRNPQINPNKLECKFKLVGGAKIYTTNEWERKL